MRAKKVTQWLEDHFSCGRPKFGSQDLCWMAHNKWIGHLLLIFMGTCMHVHPPHILILKVFKIKFAIVSVFLNCKNQYYYNF